MLQAPLLKKKKKKKGMIQMVYPFIFILYKKQYYDI